MTTHDNAPPPEGWQTERRCCGLRQSDYACSICGHWMPLHTPPNIELGQE